MLRLSLPRENSAPLYSELESCCSGKRSHESPTKKNDSLVAPQKTLAGLHHLRRGSHSTSSLSVQSSDGLSLAPPSLSPSSAVAGSVDEDPEEEQNDSYRQLLLEPAALDEATRKKDEAVLPQRTINAVIVSPQSCLVTKLFHLNTHEDMPISRPTVNVEDEDRSPLPKLESTPKKSPKRTMKQLPPIIENHSSPRKTQTDTNRSPRRVANIQGDGPSPRKSKPSSPDDQHTKRSQRSSLTIQLNPVWSPDDDAPNSREPITHRPSTIPTENEGDGRQHQESVELSQVTKKKDHDHTKRGRRSTTVEQVSSTSPNRTKQSRSPSMEPSTKASTIPYDRADEQFFKRIGRTTEPDETSDSKRAPRTTSVEPSSLSSSGGTKPSRSHSVETTSRSSSSNCSDVPRSEDKVKPRAEGASGRHRRSPSVEPTGRLEEYSTRGRRSSSIDPQRSGSSSDCQITSSSRPNRSVETAARSRPSDEKSKRGDGRSGSDFDISKEAPRPSKSKDYETPDTSLAIHVEPNSKLSVDVTDRGRRSSSCSRPKTHNRSSFTEQNISASSTEREHTSRGRRPTSIEPRSPGDNTRHTRCSSVERTGVSALSSGEEKLATRQSVELARLKKEHTTRVRRHSVEPASLKEEHTSRGRRLSVEPASLKEEHNTRGRRSASVDPRSAGDNTRRTRCSSVERNRAFSSSREENRTTRQSRSVALEQNGAVNDVNGGRPRSPSVDQKVRAKILKSPAQLDVSNEHTKANNRSSEHSPGRKPKPTIKDQDGAKMTKRDKLPGAEGSSGHDGDDDEAAGEDCRKLKRENGQVSPRRSLQNEDAVPWDENNENIAPPPRTRGRVQQLRREEEERTRSKSRKKASRKHRDAGQDKDKISKLDHTALHALMIAALTPRNSTGYVEGSELNQADGSLASEIQHWSNLVSAVRVAVQEQKQRGVAYPMPDGRPLYSFLPCKS